ncbi:MAG TPA: LacI family DNA-binding transcriptional regulator [Bryobacteraceae bacterium]|nr:LacI family DNA-binding transcriptional regulator [Bryobacteraceae bacterium]
MKKVGVRELAKLARVSVGTVDRALHARKEVNETTRQRILRIAEKHGYKPNLSARALSVGRANIRIGVCIPREIHYFYDQLRDGILDEARRFEHAGVEVLYRPVNALGSNASKIIRRLLDSDIQALVLTPGNPGEVAPLIEEAEKGRNVRVVCVATDDSQSSRSTSISVDPRLNGMLAAELMAKFIPAGSEVAIVTGMVETEDNGKKVAGFSEVFRQESQGGKIVDVIEGHEEEEQTFRKCARLLRAYPQLAGLYISTVNCIPVCKAIENRSSEGDIRVVATDLFAEAVPYFLNGTVSASIYQNPYRQGQTAVRLIVDHLLHGMAFPKVRYLNPAIALRSNLGLFRELEGVVTDALSENRKMMTGS